MRRRKIFTLLGGAAMWPIAVRAQQPAMPVIGFLHPASPSAYRPTWPSVRNGGAGLRDGQNLAIDYRWADIRRLGAGAGRRARRPKVSAGGDRIPRCSRPAATGTIPIVMIVINSIRWG